MTITTAKLTRAAGICAIAAGLLFMFDRAAAFPVGIALVGLGYSLWRDQQAVVTESLPSVGAARYEPTGA